MRITRIVSILFLVLVILAFIFLPTQINVKKTISINAPVEVVFETVNTIATWQVWSPWKYDLDHVITSYGKKESGLGAKFIWKSDSIPNMNGRLEITVSELNKHIVGSIFYDNMGETPAYNSDFYFDGKSNTETEVSWVIGDEVSWYHLPNRFLLSGAEARLSEMLETGLNSLKIYIEK